MDIYPKYVFINYLSVKKIKQIHGLSFTNLPKHLNEQSIEFSNESLQKCISEIYKIND